jgi:hypothetical protein
MDFRLGTDDFALVEPLIRREHLADITRYKSTKIYGGCAENYRVSNIQLNLGHFITIIICIKSARLSYDGCSGMAS